jgi:hypothetical protein
MMQFKALGTREPTVVRRPQVVEDAREDRLGALDVERRVLRLGLDAARERVDALRSELVPRWRWDTATRRALLTDGDAERLYDDVQAACPAAGHPLAPE